MKDEVKIESISALMAVINKENETLQENLSVAMDALKANDIRQFLGAVADMPYVYHALIQHMDSIMLIAKM